MLNVEKKMCNVQSLKLNTEYAKLNIELKWNVNFKHGILAGIELDIHSASPKNAAMRGVQKIGKNLKQSRDLKITAGHWTMPH